jgi:hypothetical protein
MMGALDGDTPAVAAPGGSLSIGFFPWGAGCSGVCWSMPWEDVVTLLETRREGRRACWNPCRYREEEDVCHWRDRARAVTCLVMDVRDGISLARLPLSEQPWEYLAHRLPDHTMAQPRYRLVLPLAQAVPLPEWPPFWEAARAALTGGHAEWESMDPERLRLCPSAEGGAGGPLVRRRGEFLLPAALVGALVAPGGRAR